MGAGGYRTIPFFQVYTLGDSGEVQKEGPFYLGEAICGTRLALLFHEALCHSV